MRMRALGLAAVIASGCTFEEAPTVPSWQVDVMPILAANCVRCHGYPTSGYATFGMRLDSYENTDVVGFDAPIQGAAVNATGIARRTRDGMRPPGELRMPPGRELGRYEGTVLRNWAGLVDGSRIELDAHPSLDPNPWRHPSCPDPSSLPGLAPRSAACWVVSRTSRRRTSAASPSRARWRRLV